MNEPTRNTLPVARRGVRPLALVGTGLLLLLSLYASRAWLPPAPAMLDGERPAPTPAAVAAANKFLDSLSDEQRKKALLEYDSDKKSAWSNLPVTFVQRNGVRLGDLTKAQRALAMGALAGVLSKGGYQKVVDIVASDQELAEGRGGKGKGGKGGKGKGGRAMFGADQYYLAFFGKPSATRPWMVQFGGHHLGVNVTVIGKHFVLTPTHTGTQPAVFQRGGKEVRPLGEENDTAFKLVNALDEKQRAKAVLSARPQGELLLGPGRDGKTVKPEGIKGSALTAKQQGMLLDVIGAWVNIVEPGAARERMAEIKGDIEETYFAWKGPTAKGSAAYFRVQGPTVVIEYAPQGGTDHIHTVIRNPKNEYGAGLRKGK